jgi:hypothetical protein
MKAGVAIIACACVTGQLRDPGDGEGCRARSRNAENQLLPVPEIPFFDGVHP